MLQLDLMTILTACGILAGLLAGCIGYLMKVERTLVRIDTSLAAFCGESQRDRTAIWMKLTESSEHQQQISERVGILETRVSLMPQDTRGRKPA